MKVLVYGAGAVGSLLGAALARAGARVTLLGRAPHGQAAAREGLRVDGPAGTGLRVSLRAVSRVQELDAPFDVLLVTVKGYDTHRAAPELPSLLAPDGRAVCFQNGVGHEEILARYVGGHHVVAAALTTSVSLPASGHVLQHTRGGLSAVALFHRYS